MVRRAILQPAQPLLSPDRRRDRQSVSHCSKAARPIYDPKGVMQGRQKVTERRSKLCLEYEMHRLTSQGVSFFVVPGSIPDGPGDMCRIAGSGQGKTVHDESLARDKGGGRNP